jgi:hypothetical protein
VLFMGGPVAAVMRVGEWAPDRARMWEHVPPTPPLSVLRPQAARRLAPAARFRLPRRDVPRLLGLPGARLESGRPSRLPRVSVGRSLRPGAGAGSRRPGPTGCLHWSGRGQAPGRPASPIAACPVGGAVDGVTSPGLPTPAQGSVGCARGPTRRRTPAPCSNP